MSEAPAAPPAGPVMRMIDVHGQPVHIVEQGKPSRQIALLIHGWSSSWYAMSPLIDLLSQRFRCISVDLPGYGNSPPLPRRTTIADYVDLLADLVDQLCDSPVVLVGHSMGGMIGVSMALRHPALVERMVLICPTITGRLSTFINLMIAPVTLLERFGLGSLIVSSVERGMVGLTDRLMRPASFAERTGITAGDYMRLRADARKPGQGRVRAECYFAMRENNLSGRLARLETPTLVLWGAEDNTVPLRDAGVIADEWPAADLRIIPKAGHWPHFETPENTRRQVAAFLGLPRLGEALQAGMEDEELQRIRDIAQFLAHSDLGRDLNLTQRTRLAAQFRQYQFPPFAGIVSMDQAGNEMYLIQGGTVEVWNDPDAPAETPRQPRRVATLKPGQITGELAMLDQGLRSADLISGPEGSLVLGLERDRLLALCEDDSVLGTRLMWNIATAMSHRVRFILWQLQRASQRSREEAAQRS